MLHFKLLLLLCILSTTTAHLQSTNFKLVEHPKWVELNDTPNKIDDSDEPFNYLLIDNQFNSIAQKNYYKYAYQVNNSEGVQTMSSIEISYDPKFQSVEIHDIAIDRSGKLIKIAADFLEMQREISMEEALYTGDITIVNNIQDVRPGDIIVYSFTINGQNPLLDEHVYASFYQEFSLGVALINQSIITDQELEIYNPDGLDDTPIKTPYGMKYQWVIENAKAKYPGAQSPSWYNPYKRIELSSFRNWQEVAEWASPLYTVDQSTTDSLRIEIGKEIDLNSPTEAEIVKTIEFVQDQIRYLGYEHGINAFKPHDPSDVLKQRFGDCKDKSLLLVSLLRMMDLEAYPVLVNTSIGKKLNEYLPSPLNFDHCIVQFVYDQSSYYIDPTISQQRGGFRYRHIPSYGYVLPIKPDSADLVYVQDDIIPLVQVNEIIDVNEVGGGGSLKIQSIYSDAQADQTRANFKSEGKLAQQNSYKSFYANLYPSIELPEIKISDSVGLDYNLLTIYEEYVVPEMWELEGEKKQTFTYRALDLQDKLNKSSNYQAQEPYNLGSRIEYIQSTTINLPETWTILDDDVKISNEYFDYSYKVRSDLKSNRSFSIQHRYYQKKGFIDPSDIKKTLQDYEKAYDNTAYQLYKNGELVSNSDSAISWILLIIALAIGSILGYFLFKSLYAYDPYSEFPFSNKAIGGWMIIPLISLCIAPLIIVFNLVLSFKNEGLGLNAIETLWTSNVENGTLYVYWLLAEFIILLNIIIYDIVALYLFIRRRSSVPKVIIGFYLIYLLYLIFSAIVSMALEDDTTGENIKSIVQQLIASGIWSAYFLMSDRVKETFTRRLKPTNPPMT